MATCDTQAHSKRKTKRKNSRLARFFGKERDCFFLSIRRTVSRRYPKTYFLGIETDLHVLEPESLRLLDTGSTLTGGQALPLLTCKNTIKLYVKQLFVKLLTGRCL